MAPVQVHVGVCGAGLGGLAAAIALQRGGAEVTILEAATELGEIGAGIQVRLVSSSVPTMIDNWRIDFPQRLAIRYTMGS